MAYDVTYNADFNILATITAPIDWTYCPNCGCRIIETNSGEDNNSGR